MIVGDALEVSMNRIIWILTLLPALAIPALSQAADNQGNHETTAKGENTAKKDEPAPYDNSAWLPFLAAAQVGGGWDSKLPTAHAGIKLGISPFDLDLQYDRIHGQNGFSTEVSGMLPVFRFPGPMADESRKYVRVYFEPGLGYRAGGGPFGGYSSAKVMVTLFDDEWRNDEYYPYVEFQRRFPFNSPLQGDNRISIGLMWAICEHCGLD